MRMRIIISLLFLLSSPAAAIAESWEPSKQERDLFGYACELIQEGGRSDSQIKNMVAQKFVQQMGMVTGDTLEVATQFALHFGQNGLELSLGLNPTSNNHCDSQKWDMNRVAAFNLNLRERWASAPSNPPSSKNPAR